MLPSQHHHTAADKATRFVAVATVSGLAMLAGWISYHHMLLLARRSGQTGIDAHAFPLTVDGLDLIGVLVLLADRRTGRRSGWLPWTVLAVGTLASISANIAVAPDNLVARAISGWSAVALLAAAKMLAHLFEPVDAGNAVATTPALVSAPASQPSLARSPKATPPDVAGPAPSQINATSGRVPTTPAAYARWSAIWAATRHLPAATRDTAQAHGVSLRTLQFIRSAGEAGQLAPPPSQPPMPPPFAPTDLRAPAEADPVEPAKARPATADQPA